MSSNILGKRQKFDILEAQLRNERITFKPYWKDLSKYILPRRSRFFISDVNKGDRRNLDVIDSTASMGARTLSSGMMTGITSPARQWFKLSTSNEMLNDDPEVKQYLSTVENKMRDVFLRSNLYNVLPVIYGDLGTFGSGCLFMEEDSDDGVSFNSFLIGAYMIANDKKGRVRVFMREFQMSIRQLVEKFGMVNGNPRDIKWENLSQLVRDNYDRGQYETMIDVNHVVCPNDDYAQNKVESKYKKFKSVYYEKGVSGSSSSGGLTSVGLDKFLSEKGYDYFPVLVPRWEVAGEDTYGTNCPGMMILGDVKQLQFGEKRIAMAIDQKVKPAMVGPVSLKNAKASILPGDITYIDEREGSRGFRRLFEIDFDIRELEQKQQQIRERISKAYYEDLFLMLANSNRRQITAREIEERHEEKLLALGPVLERINQDLLDPLIENTFAILEEQGQLPEVPEALASEDYSIEYISVMAQAQKLAGIGGIERLIGFIGQVAAIDPSIVDKINVDEAVQEYAAKLGVDPSMLKTREEVEAIRENRAIAQQQAEEQAAVSEMVSAGKSLSETNMNEDTALSAILQGESLG